MALSVGLLSAAGLFIRNLATWDRMGSGLPRDHVLLVTLDSARSGYSNERLSVRTQELLVQLGAGSGACVRQR
jgi:hypothetical protein